MKKNICRIVRRTKLAMWAFGVECANVAERFVKKTRDVLIFDTSMGSDNMGDSIIKFYCDKVLCQIFPNKVFERVPTHRLPDEKCQKKIARYKTKIVCGTNLMTPHYEEYSIWKSPRNLFGYSNIITLGVGWEYYCDDISKVSKFVYRKILSKKGIHSVRDSYTEQKFHEMGIHNVLNTGCPTLWELTEENCRKIPKQKANKVITTITDYNRDEKCDQRMLEILCESYEKVYVWIQGNEDIEYLKTLSKDLNIEIIERNIEAYTAILKKGDVDYVGTRLHAGIHALNCSVRSIIIAIDNRAIEMGKDFGLPIILRKDIDTELQCKVYQLVKINIKLPWKSIQDWKKQFLW